MALVYTAIVLTSLLGFLALGIDLGFSYVISNELKSVADAGALTAASSYVAELRDAEAEQKNLDNVDTRVDIEREVLEQVELIIGRSRVLNLGADSDITVTLQFGRYTFTSTPYDGSQFTDLTAELKAGNVGMERITSFRVVATRGDTPNNTWTYKFANILGFGDLFLERASVSILAPRNFMLVLDTSASMDNITYVRPEGPVPLPPWGPDESFLTWLPEKEEAGTPWYSPHAPGPEDEDRFEGFGPIYPQPLQVVLDSSLVFLQMLAGRGSIGDQAGVNYFSQGSASKIELRRMTREVVDGDFTNLLRNYLLYENLEMAGEAPEHFQLRDGISNFDFTTYQYDDFIAIPNGQTNIGEAIDLAVSNIYDSLGAITQSTSVIILFTDGRPTCVGLGNCFREPLTANESRRAREYTFKRAQQAIKQGVLIYPISYGSLDQPTIALLDEIALLSGLPDGHYSAGNETDVDEIRQTLIAIFNDISLLIPFVLVG